MQLTPDGGLIAFIVPTPGYRRYLVDETTERHLPVKTSITSLEESGSDSAELILRLAGNADTGVIALLVDKVRNGPALVSAIRNANKPVVVLRVGKRAVPAEDNQVFEAAMKQSGAIVAPTLDRFFDAATVLTTCLPGLVSAGNAAPGTNTSFEASEFLADACAEVGLEVPNIPLPAFPTPERTARAYRVLVDYTAAIQQKRASIYVSSQDSVTPMNIEGSGVMDEHETKRLLDRWEITVVPETLVTGPGRHEFTPLRKLAIHFGFPVVLKAVRKDIIDKVGMGAVASGLQDVDELELAWEKMHDKFPDAAWLVHPMLPGDIELVIGAHRDPAFGPVILLGGGGVMTELYNDIAVRVAPYSMDDAMAMIEETRSAALMRGFHGLPVHDPVEVAAVLVKVGNLMLGQPTVQELAINPLLLTEKGPIVMDAMAVIGTGEPG